MPRQRSRHDASRRGSGRPSRQWTTGKCRTTRTRTSISTCGLSLPLTLAIVPEHHALQTRGVSRGRRVESTHRQCGQRAEARGTRADAAVLRHQRAGQRLARLLSEQRSPQRPARAALVQRGDRAERRRVRPLCGREHALRAPRSLRLWRDSPVAGTFSRSLRQLRLLPGDVPPARLRLSPGVAPHAVCRRDRTQTEWLRENGRPGPGRCVQRGWSEVAARDVRKFAK